MSLLVPDTGLLFWMTLSFGVVLFILAKFGFPVIVKAIEKRNEFINSSLESARAAQQKLAELNLEAQDILNKAKDERSTILREAQQASQKIVDAAKVSAQAEQHVILTKAATEAEELKRRAMTEIVGQVAGISVRIAEKVIGEKLDEDGQQASLINRLLEEETAIKH